MPNNNENMTVKEAGKRGGEKTATTHSREFYQKIGHMGGEKGGRKGGEATSEKYGPEFYHEIGTKGGRKVRELVEEGKRAQRK